MSSVMSRVVSITRAARTFLLAVVAVLASTLVVVGGGAAPAEAKLSTTQIRSMASGTYEQRVQYWINQERAKRGKAKLRVHTCTDSLSERWSRHLADTGQFYHQSLSPFFSRCHARYAGETLARGVVEPRTVVRLWMQSAPHRRVMLSSSPRRVGVAAVLDHNGTWVVTANYTRL
jgi:uncharacterized protein YkwD